MASMYCNACRYTVSIDGQVFNDGLAVAVENGRATFKINKLNINYERTRIDISCKIGDKICPGPITSIHSVCTGICGSFYSLCNLS